MAERDYVVVQEGAEIRGTVADCGWRETNYGTFRHDFKEDLLFNLCSNEDGIQTGPFGSQLHKRDYVQVGTPIITVEHLGENRIIHGELPSVSDYDRNRLSKYTLRQGDIVFSRVGSVDRRSLVRDAEEGWLFSGRCLRVRPDVNKIDPTYLSYFFGLSAFREHIRSIAVGATMPSLNTQILSNVPIVYPPLPEQRAIAHVLGTLDDKIELNRQMNETLEEMARALFKSWFVDFDPVRAKIDGRWRRGQSLPGLPADLYDLFPDRLVPSEFGEIPEGWEVNALDEIAMFLNGLALQKYPAAGGAALPVIKIAQLRAGHTLGAAFASADIPSQYVVQDGDLLFSWSGSLEVDIWTGGPGALNQHLFKVTSTEHPKWLLYQWLQVHLQAFRSIAADKATTMGHIRRHHLNEALTVVPDSDLLNAITSNMQPLFDSALALSLESRTLATQRDMLLPKLVSGEMGVAKASTSLNGSAD